MTATSADRVTARRGWLILGGAAVLVALLLTGLVYALVHTADDLRAQVRAPDSEGFDLSAALARDFAQCAQKLRPMGVRRRLGGGNQHSELGGGRVSGQLRSHSLG